MSDYSQALQSAVFALLSTGDAIAEGRVYDDVPDGTDDDDGNFPYVQIGESDDLPDDTSAPASSGDGGIATNLTLHVWSRARGKKEAQGICSQIYDALHGVSLAVTGRASALAWVRRTGIFTDQDGITRHGVVQVEIIHRA